MLLKFAVLYSLIGTITGAVVELSPENWDKEVVNSNKNVFVKFYAPWCGHCKKLKPDWDKLGEKYGSSTSVMIGDVDCTESGKDLCEKFGVKGYPTLKAFWKDESIDYRGGRTFEDLDTYVSSLKPLCSVKDPEHCTQTEIDEITVYKKMTVSDIKEKLQSHETELKNAKKAHEELLKTLQEQYNDDRIKLDELEAKLGAKMKMIANIIEELEKEKPNEKDEV